MPTKRGTKPRSFNPALPGEGGEDVGGCSNWDVPPHLTGEAVEAWHHLVRLLSERNTLHKTDPVMVEAYAMAVQNLRAGQEEIVKGGVNVISRYGTPVLNPSCHVVNQATIRIRSIVEALGLTPSTAHHSTMSKDNGDAKSDEWGSYLGIA